MIRPSRRRVEQGRSETLDLHNRLARQRDFQRHLRLAAVIALVLAVATWLLGLDLLLRGSIVVAGALLSWLVPLGSSRRWALDWIAQGSGLAYETALESALHDDPYGFAATLRERAQESSQRVEQPQHPAWWLPVLILAVGALLLPSLSLVSPGGNMAGGPGTPLNGGQTPFSGAEDAAQPEPETAEEQRSRVDNREGAAQSDAPGQGESRQEGDAGEQAALDRFLENLRERPETGEGEPPEGESGGGQRQAGEQSQDSGENQQGQNGQGGEGERQAGDGERSSQEGRQGEQQGEAGEGEDSEAADQQNPFAETGTSQEQQSGEDESQSQQGVAGEQGNQGEEGEEGNEAGGNGLDEGAGDETGVGEGAGGRPSDEQQAGVASAAGGEELFLEGELQSGPVTPGGTVQLPGATEGDLPGARSPQSYAQERERAVSEGRIPLEYQEIIRNYFR